MLYRLPTKCRPIPIHLKDDVERGIRRDVRLGVLEPVPTGDPLTWCHQMVICPKKNGKSRRTVDFQALNKFSIRETHFTASPYDQARSVPANTKKTVMDAWNGYHSVPLHQDDRHLTTFLTPWGRFRYKTTPQGYAASGDGYTKRYDDIISHLDNHTKCIDDALVWGDSAQDCHNRTIEWITTCANNGITLNSSTLGCPNLTVATDHEPLTKILGDRSIDKIPSTRLRNLKEKCLPFSFHIKHIPGVKNIAPDTVSRAPTGPRNPPGLTLKDDVSDINQVTRTPSLAIPTLLFTGVPLPYPLTGPATKTYLTSGMVTHREVRDATQLDPEMLALHQMILRRPVPQRNHWPHSIRHWFHFRKHLSTNGKSLRYKHRLIIPAKLRQDCLDSLHMAHQGTTQMSAKAN